MNGTLTAANTISVTNSATSTQSFSAGSLIANAASNPLIVISPQLGSISSISTPNGNWKLVQTRNADVSVNNVPAANFVQYDYSGGSISGSGNAILSAYDPGTITKTFANVGGGTHQVRKTYDGTNSTSSATFGSDSLNDPLNVNLNLNSPTFTYSQANVGTSLTVTANAAYSINPVHSKHGTVYGLATSGSAQTLTGRINQKDIVVRGQRHYDATQNMYPANFTVQSGLVGSETLTFGGSNDTFSTMVANESAFTSVSLSNVVLADGSNGGLAANYNISASDFQIQKRPLAVQVQRQYDGTATFSSSDSVFFEYQTMSSPPSNTVGRTGVLLETLSLSGTGTTSGSATNAGTYDLSGFTLSDGIAASSNYTITGNIRGVIQQRVLDLDGARANNGSSTIAASAMTLDNLVGTETLTLSGNGVASQSTPGNNISFSDISGFSLGNGSNGGLGANYTLTGGTHVVDITATTPYITGIKVYDGSLTVSGTLLSFVDPSNQAQMLLFQGQEQPHLKMLPME